jgi:hypothetical protein
MFSPNNTIARAQREEQRVTVPQMLTKWGESSTAVILQHMAETHDTRFRVGAYIYQLVIDAEIEDSRQPHVVYA